MSRLFFTLLIFLGLAVSPAVAQDPAEIRALYVPTFSTRTQAQCDDVIAKVLNSNINQVYVQIRSRGDAYYYPNREDDTYPNPEPRGQLWAIVPEDLDILQYYIDRLHNADPPVEVHAWLTTYNIWNRSTPPSDPTHVYNAHPDWITRNRAGVTYTWDDDAPLDPGIPEVQEYLYDVFLDVVRNYDIDGLHFDYIRLLGVDSGFHPAAKARFLADTGWNFDTQNPNGELEAVYRAWRRDQLAKLVQRINSQAMLEKPWVDVSAFIVNFTNSIQNLAQGYNWWVAYDAIDTLHLSAYSSSISTALSHWNTSVSRLAANNDEHKRRLVTALGSYLMTSGTDNRDAVIQLRNQERQPDGFNFFAKVAIFDEDGGRLANDLFNPGGPMANWAPVPPMDHKVAMGMNDNPPNPPAAASVSMVDSVPRITFQRPAPNGDGDLPVRYRLYRDSIANVRLYYDNMVMEWWDLDSERTSFQFDDTTASGVSHYAVVAYDNWNNSARTSAGSITAPTTEYIIETRSGGKNVGDYSEVSGTFFNSTAHSTAPGTTSNIGSRFALPHDAKNNRARFTPSGLPSGTYTVEVTCFGFSSANAPNITVRISDANGVSTSLFNLTAANAGNVWAPVGTMTLTQGAGHFVEFDNATQSNSGSDDRMNAAAVRLTRTAEPSEPKEPKPPVSEPVPSIAPGYTLVLSETPISLNYDDTGGAGEWATTTFGAGLHNGSARFYAANSFPVTSYAVWVADLPVAGTWAIEGWMRDSSAGLATAAQYRYVDGSGTVRNTTTTQRVPGGWNINIDGAAGESQRPYFNKGRVYVTLYGNAAGAEMLYADAIRFRLVEPDLPQPDPSPELWSLY